MVHYKARPTSRRELANIAQKLRRLLCVEQDLYFPIIEFIELVLPKIDKEFDLEIVETSELPPNTYALTYPDDKIIKIRADVYYGACANQGRARFTIAHELCHYLLHDEENISFARSKSDIPKYMDPEWQANTFAAELLAPGYLIKGMNVEDITEKCRISYQCAHIQESTYS